MKLLLILVAMAIPAMGQARCPSTITYNNQHTFTLAALKESEIEDRQPQSLYKEAAEACYEDCNAAEIMSFSTSYWKHRSPMTILDRAAKYLIEADFLQINDTYFVNHIAIESDGPVGLGCFALETPSEFTLYPLDDPVCSSTQFVVCGMPGIDSTVDGQKIANAIHTIEIPIESSNSSDTVNPDDGKNNHTVVNLPSGINLAEIITHATADEEKKPEVNEKKALAFFGEDELDEEQVSMDDDLRYSVIKVPQHPSSLSSASLLCAHHDKLGSLYSSSIPHFSTWFQRAYPSAKIIIESWNGDSYGAGDAQCLMFSSSQGVHLSECADASTVLCEA